MFRTLLLRRYRQSRASANRASWLLLFYAATWISVGLLTLGTYTAATEVGGTLPIAALLEPILFGLTVWPVMKRYMSRRDWATIANGVLLLVYLYFGVGCAFYVTTYDSIDLPALQIPEYAAPVMAAAILGAACYRIGAEGPWFKYLVRLLPSLPRTPRWSTPIRLGVLVSAVAAVLINVHMMSDGNFGYRLGDQSQASGVYSILSYVAGLGMVALVVGFYYWFTSDQLTLWDKGVIVALACVQLMSALLTGMKESALELLIFAAVPYVVTGHRLKLKVMCPAVVLVVALFALNPYYRVALSYVGTDRNRIDAAVDAVDLMTSGRIDLSNRLLGDGSEQFLHRVSLFGYMLPVVEKTPSLYDYRHWKRYPGLIPTAIVPRILWPDKPLQDQSGDFNRAYVTNSSNATTPTTIGWAYMEGGFVGVAVLMTVLGAVARLVQAYSLRRHGSTLAAVVLFTVSFRLLFQLEGDPYWILNGLIKELIATGFAYWAIVYAPRIVVSRRRVGLARSLEASGEVSGPG